MRNDRNEGANETPEAEIDRHSREDQAREAQRQGERSAEIQRGLDGGRRGGR